MKQIKKSAASLALSLLCLALAGCQSPEVVAHLSNGFEEVKHPTHPLLGGSDVPRVSFEHLEADGKTSVIWPSLYGVREAIHSDIAIFVGDKAFLEDGSKTVHPRLFAVQTNGLPLDITDEVLWRWSKTNGKDFSKTLTKFSLVTPGEKNGQLELHLEFWSPQLWSEDKDWPDKSDLQLDWKLVFQIMRAVKVKGVVEKDLRWHTPYIGEVY